jgi:hypothetical protein
MPLTIVAPTIVRYTMKMVWGSSKIATNVDINVDVSSGVGVRSKAIDALHGMVLPAWQNAMIPNVATDCTFVGAHWIDLDSPDGATGDLSPHAEAPTVGTRSDQMEPPNVCVLIHLNSASHRGERQGRMFFAPVRSAQVDSHGNVLAAAITGWTSQVDGFRQAVDNWTGTVDAESAAWRTVHVHKPNPSDQSTWTWSSTTIDSVSCDPRVATQRRRLR